MNEYSCEEIARYIANETSSISSVEMEEAVPHLCADDTGAVVFQLPNGQVFKLTVSEVEILAWNEAALRE